MTLLTIPNRQEAPVPKQILRDPNSTPSGKSDSKDYLLGSSSLYSSFSTLPTGLTGCRTASNVASEFLEDEECCARDFTFSLVLYTFY